jgi:hypothetical protein
MRTRCILGVVAGCVLALGVLLAGVPAWLKTGYWFDKQPIKRGFARIPGCTLISVTGNEDVALEHITTKVHVQGKGLLILSELRPESFQQTGEIRLHQIGNVALRQHTFGFDGVYVTATHEPVKSHAYAGWVDIGAQGPYASLLPVKIEKVQDVVRHFDDILTALSKWPKEPEKLSITTKDGKLYEASIVEVMEEKTESEPAVVGKGH